MRLPHPILSRMSFATAALAVLLSVSPAATASSSHDASATTAARSVAAGVFHSCAITVAGGVKCWGQNDYGELGDGTQNASLTPVDVSGLASGATAVAVSDSPNGAHTCALTSSGGVKCWGANHQGQLGDGRSSCVRCTVPVDVQGLTSGAVKD